MLIEFICFITGAVVVFVYENCCLSTEKEEDKNTSTIYHFYNEDYIDSYKSPMQSSNSPVLSRWGQEFSII